MYDGKNIEIMIFKNNLENIQYDAQKYKKRGEDEIAKSMQWEKMHPDQSNWKNIAIKRSKQVKLNM